MDDTSTKLMDMMAIHHRQSMTVSRTNTRLACATELLGKLVAARAAPDAECVARAIDLLKRLEAALERADG